MTTKAANAKRSDLNVLPMLRNESLYVGVDIGKQHHVAGFVSNTLLKRHEHFKGCPVLIFDQSREGFRQLIDRVQSFVPLEQCFFLMEKTGHYHRALELYLLELDISVYVMHVQERPMGMLKSDNRDALMLANHLYNQLEKGIQVADKTQLVRRAIPPSEAASQLKGLTRHRYELMQESTQRKNKLTAICDELFPEYTQIFKNPNIGTALAIREQFPTPHAIATASLTALKGKLKVVGRIAGQIIEMIYALLKKDAEVLSKVPPGVEPPAPMLYDRAIHQAHRQGKYHSLKPVEKREPIVLLPKSSL